MKKITIILLLILATLSVSSCNLFVKKDDSSYQGAMFPVITDDISDFSLPTEGSVYAEETESITVTIDLLPFPDSNTGLWGYINGQGKFVIEPKYKLVLEFGKNSQAQVLTEDNLISIDTQGNKIAYKNELEFSENGLAACIDDSGYWGYVNENMEFIIKAQFISAGIFAGNGLACVWDGLGYGWIDSSGQYAIEPEYSWGSDFSDNGLAAAQKGDGLCGYINEKEEYIIQPQFKSAQAFGKNGLAAVSDPKDFWGFIDETGGYAIEPQFIAEQGFTPSFDENGLACVFNGIAWGFIDKTGKYVIEPKYYWYSGFAKNGLAPVMEDENGLTGYINLKGDYVLEPQFKQAWNFFESGIALVQTQDGLWGYIDESGKFIIGPK